MAEVPERNLALELVRVTEAAAMAAARWQGRGNKDAVDQAAVDGMRAIMATVDMDGVIVIGEGEKDEAPMLYNGETGWQRTGHTGRCSCRSRGRHPANGRRNAGCPGRYRHGRARLHVRTREASSIWTRSRSDPTLPAWSTWRRRSSAI